MSNHPEAVELGNYRVLHKENGSLWMLGRGGYGTTYKAEHKHLGRECALKVINDDLLKDNAARRRFLQEAQAAASLDHAHIARVYDFGESEGVFYYAMAYCSGGDLEEFSASRGAQPWSVVKELAKQMLSALGMAHGKGLLHRDLKPSNIMLASDDGSVDLRLIDFGLVKVLDNHEAASTNLMLTQDGSFMGNPLTASPEQLREEDLDARSDLFSLGVTLWYLLVGGSPFSGVSTAELVHRRLGNDPYTNDLPTDLDDCGRFVLGGLLSKDRNERFNNAEEVLIALESGMVSDTKDSTGMNVDASLASASTVVSADSEGVVNFESVRDWNDVWEINEQLQKFSYGSYYTCTGKLPGVPITTMFVPDVDAASFESVTGYADRILNTGTQLLNGFYQKGLLANEVAYVCPPFPSGNYQWLLQFVGALDLKDYLEILQQIARAVDESTARDIPGNELETGEVMFGLRENAEGGPQSEAEWSAYFQKQQAAGEDYVSNLEITVLPKLVDAADLDEAMVTLGSDDLATNPIARFGGLLYRSISGMSVKQSAYLSPSAHVPSSNLSEESNRFLSRVISAREIPDSAVGLLKDLCEMEGVDWETDVLDATLLAKDQQKTMITQGHASVSAMISSMPASAQKSEPVTWPQHSKNKTPQASLGKSIQSEPTSRQSISNQASKTTASVQASPEQSVSVVVPAAAKTKAKMKPKTEAITEFVKSRRGVVIATAVACLLFILGLSIWHFGKDEKSDQRGVAGDNLAKVENPVILEFAKVVIGAASTPDGVALSLLDSEGEAIGLLELNGNRAEIQNIPAELFSDESRWPIKLRLDGEGYRMADIGLKLADFTDSGNDRRKYNKSLKLDLRPYLVIDPVVKFNGNELELPIASLRKHLYPEHLSPEHPPVDWKLRDENGKISVLLPSENKFPLKAILTIPHMEELYFTMKRGLPPIWNLKIAEKEVRFSGLGEFTTLKFIPNLDKVDDTFSKQILKQHLGDYTAQFGMFDEGRGSWKLPALDGEIEVSGVKGKWKFKLNSWAKWRVLSSSDQSGASIETDSSKFLELSQLSREGDHDAQYELGLKYLKAGGGVKNESASTEWFRMAAEQGDKGAQHNLAVAYALGRGVGVNQREAIRWYVKAANQGFAKSQGELALCYQTGTGVKADGKLAEKWYMKAINQGDRGAMFNLATLYGDENSKLHDGAHAIKMYEQAAELGHPLALYNLGLCHQNGDYGLKRDDNKARDYLQRAVKKGNVEAKKALDSLN